MSKKKSLGSSPIGFPTNGSLNFIPDLDIPKSKKTASVSQITRDREMLGPSASEERIEKKTVSYYLEVDLIAKVKSMATRKEMCYSALVSDALNRMFIENG